MMTLLLEPFQFAFMNNALLISLMVAVPCAFPTSRRVRLREEQFPAMFDDADLCLV